MTGMTLEVWAASHLSQMPDVPDDRGFTFTPENTPKLPQKLACSELAIQKNFHTYNTIWRVDHLSWFAEKETYAAIGLALMAAAIHPAYCELSLDHSATDLTSISIDSTTLWAFPDLEFAKFRLEEFEYWPSGFDKHPWLNGLANRVESLPWFWLTNRNDCVVTEEEWQARSVLMGFGGYTGHLNLAALLLDIGRPSNQRQEVVLEGEGGFRGVGVHSAECSFYLPGHLAWPPAAR